MEDYTEEFLLQTDKSSIMSILADPNRFAGITGHIVFFKIFDSENQSYVAQGSARKPINKYRAVFIYEDNSGNLNHILGTMEGPEIMPNQISYKGESDDRKLNALFVFSFTSKGSDTILNIKSEINLRQGFFSRLFNKFYGNMAEHLVKCHIIPYLSKIGPQVSYNLTEISKTLGNMNELILTLRNLPKIDLGYVIIKGDTFKFIASIKDGELRNMKLKSNGNEISGGEALAKLFTLNGRAEMSIYRLPAEEVLLEKINKL